MKKIFSILMVLGCFYAGLVQAAGEPPFLENRRPPRQIRYLKGAGLSLNADNTEIVVSSDAYKSTRFAVSELKKFLSCVLGGDIPVVNKVSPGKISLVVGINDFSRSAGIDAGRLCRDAFIIRTVKNSIYILGLDDPSVDTARVVSQRYGGGSRILRSHQRGTLFGVYDFLERFGGVRFYHADDLFTIVPKKAAISVPVVDIYDRPDNESRFYSIFSGWADDDVPGKYWDPHSPFSPSKALDFCRYRGDTQMIPNCHGLSRLYFMERFRKTHPEYFALHANGTRHCDPAFMHTGQLCFNSAVMDEIYEDAKAILGGNIKEIQARDARFYNKWNVFNQWGGHTPGKIFNFMPQDGYYHCRCPKCLPHMKDDQSISNFIWGKAVELANRLKAAGVKGYVSTMAYPPCHLPPTNVKLPDNIIVMVAQNGPWDPPEVHRRNVALVDHWNRISNGGCKVWMWNYACKVPSRNLVLPGVPYTTPWAVGRYYQDMAGKINGAFLESNSSAMIDTFMMNSLDYYIFGKVNWDNRIDYHAVLDEYFRLCYGAGAPEIKKIFQTIENLWLTKIGGKTIMYKLGPKNVPPSDNELWNKTFPMIKTI